MDHDLMALATVYGFHTCIIVSEMTSLQEGPGSSSPAAAAAEPSLAGMSLSDDAQPQASNGHAEPAAAPAAVPGAAESADTADPDASSAGTSSAPVGLPQTQDELIEVFATLLWDLTCTP